MRDRAGEEVEQGHRLVLPVPDEAEQQHADRGEREQSSGPAGNPRPSGRAGRRSPADCWPPRNRKQSALQSRSRSPGPPVGCGASSSAQARAGQEAEQIDCGGEGTAAIVLGPSATGKRRRTPLVPGLAAATISPAHRVRAFRVASLGQRRQRAQPRIGRRRNAQPRPRRPATRPAADQRFDALRDHQLAPPQPGHHLGGTTGSARFSA